MPAPPDGRCAMAQGEYMSNLDEGIPAQDAGALAFETRISHIQGHAVVRLPADVSGVLPSRGMGMARVTLGGVPWVAALEPDGKGGHWFLVEAPQLSQAGCLPGQAVAVTLAPLEDWPEPPIPEDITAGVRQAGLLPVWDSLTIKARWEWLRWIRSTANPATRQKRILVACDKLLRGERRPCCFNSAGCTVAEVSRAGVLQEPAEG